MDASLAPTISNSCVRKCEEKGGTHSWVVYCVGTLVDPRSGHRIREAPQVPQEQARVTQVPEPEEEHDEPLDPDASARVRGRASTERIEVVHHLGGVDARGADVLVVGGWEAAAREASRRPTFVRAGVKA